MEVEDRGLNKRTPPCIVAMHMALALALARQCRRRRRRRLSTTHRPLATIGHARRATGEGATIHSSANATTPP
jgi:hypothetical protein